MQDNAAASAYAIEGYVIDVDRRIVLHGDDEVEIQPRAFDLLVYLVENRDRAVSKVELQDAIWPGMVVSETVLSRAVMKARKAVGDNAHEQHAIRTLHGHGYRWVAELLPAPGEPADFRIPTPASATPEQPANRYQFWRIDSMWALVVFPLLIAVIYLSLSPFIEGDSSGPASQDAPESPPAFIEPKFTLNAWPGAEQAFRNDARWLGGDGGHSVELGNDRFLWLFHDSFVAREAGKGRGQAEFIRNSIAIQEGNDLASSQLDFHWRTANELGDRPSAFFPDLGEHWYWPIGGIMLEDQLMVFLLESKPVPTGFRFEHTRVTAVVVENPEDEPGSWRTIPAPLPRYDKPMLVGYGTIIREGMYVYAFSRLEHDSQFYLARWPYKSLVEGNADSLEWWTGALTGWHAQGPDLESIEVVLKGSVVSFGVQFVPERDHYVLTEGIGLGPQIFRMRQARRLTGPWSPGNTILRPPEYDRNGAIIYGGQLHPGQAGADVVMSYHVNHGKFDEMIRDRSLYFPRIIRIDFD